VAFPSLAQVNVNPPAAMNTMSPGLKEWPPMVNVKTPVVGVYNAPEGVNCAPIETCLAIQAVISSFRNVVLFVSNVTAFGYKFEAVSDTTLLEM
jgi:hypothetical protein